jgi:uncharacterized membrane protein
MRRFNNFLRNTFLAGIFTLLPIVITFFIFVWLFKGFTNFLLPYIKISESFFEITLSPSARRILSFILLCIIIFFIGFFAKNYFGKKIFYLFECLIKKIPVVKTIYVSSKQIISAFQNANDQNFSKVVLIEYPRKGLYSVAFLTNYNTRYYDSFIKKKCISVFVATTPNPTSGYIVIVPEEDVFVLDMTIEEGFRYVISAGLVAPERLIEQYNKKSESKVVS